MTGGIFDVRWPDRFKMLLRSLFRRTSLEAELHAELEDHLAREIEQNIAAGMTPDKAREAARKSIGPVALYQEECRDARATRLLDTAGRDFRYAFRMLRRTPLFTASAIATLALGIGANTAVFTFVENILLRSLPVMNPQQLVAVNWGESANMSYPNYVDFRDRNQVFSSLAAHRFIQANLSLRSRENFLSWGFEASGNYFQTLGVHPFSGRFFGPADDDKPNAHPVVVLSYRYWQTHFASNPGAVGGTIKISGYPFTIIGIAPPEFGGTELLFNAEFWIPMSMELEAEPGSDWLHQRMAGDIWVLGRLKPGVSRPQAEADLDRIAQQIAHAYPNQFDARAKFHLSKPGLVGQALRSPITGFGIVLTIIATLALLLACVNLAGMLLARASDRGREVAIRLALGAGRRQLLRQFLVESALLGLSAGAVGFALAFIACRWFSSLGFGIDLPFNHSLQPDMAVLFYTLGLACLAVLLFGLAPALHSLRASVIAGLREAALPGRFRRLNMRDLLVAGQIALSVVLVVSSVLVVRSLRHALSLNLGFNPENVVTLSFEQRSKDYTPALSRRLDAALLQKAAAIPGIEAAGIIDNMPLRVDHGNNSIISRADRPVPPPAERQGATIYTISPGYLRAAGTKLLSGRDLNEHDNEHAPPMGLVNEALARALFQNEDPLGRHVRLSDNPADKGFEIVGVVETGKYEYLGEDPHPAVFLPIAQTGTGWTTLVARTHLAVSAAVPLLQKAALDLNPDLSFSNVGSLKDQLSLQLFPARAAAIVLGSFGIFAMLLSATGLFALMAYAVSRRSREIGIRMALGANPHQVLSAVLKRTVILCSAGVTAGTLLTLASARLLSFVLYGVSPRDPLTYATALLLMLAVALAAVWHPALRAIHIDPAITLREQ
ncbi:MAG TPA: ABC transporter permease [Bryobacteraceae bacterium]|nr:ABC transporter permease [Bryobacteraceae bacterium]